MPVAPCTQETETATCGRAHSELNPSAERSEMQGGRTEPMQRCGEPSESSVKQPHCRQGSASGRLWMTRFYPPVRLPSFVAVDLPQD